MVLIKRPWMKSPIEYFTLKDPELHDYLLKLMFINVKVCGYVCCMTVLINLFLTTRRSNVHTITQQTQSHVEQAETLLTQIGLAVAIKKPCGTTKLQVNQPHKHKSFVNQELAYAKDNTG